MAGENVIIKLGQARQVLEQLAKSTTDAKLADDEKRKSSHAMATEAEKASQRVLKAYQSIAAGLASSDRGLKGATQSARDYGEVVSRGFERAAEAAVKQRREIELNEAATRRMTQAFAMKVQGQDVSRSMFGTRDIPSLSDVAAQQRIRAVRPSILGGLSPEQLAMEREEAMLQRDVLGLSGAKIGLVARENIQRQEALVLEQALSAEIRKQSEARRVGATNARTMLLAEAGEARVGRALPERVVLGTMGVAQESAWAKERVIIAARQRLTAAAASGNAAAYRIEKAALLELTGAHTSATQRMMTQTEKRAAREKGMFGGGPESAANVLGQSNRMRFGIFQLTSGIQDAATALDMLGNTTAGWSMAMRGASNNLGVMISTMGPYAAVLGTIALIAGPPVVRWLWTMVDASAAAAKGQEELQKQFTKTKAAMKDLAKAREEEHASRFEFEDTMRPRTEQEWGKRKEELRGRFAQTELTRQAGLIGEKGAIGPLAEQLEAEALAGPEYGRMTELQEKARDYVEAYQAKARTLFGVVGKLTLGAVNLKPGEKFQRETAAAASKKFRKTEPEGQELSALEKSAEKEKDLALVKARDLFAKAGKGDRKAIETITQALPGFSDTVERRAGTAAEKEKVWTKAEKEDHEALTRDKNIFQEEERVRRERFEAESDRLDAEKDALKPGAKTARARITEKQSELRERFARETSAATRSWQRAHPQEDKSLERKRMLDQIPTAVLLDELTGGQGASISAAGMSIGMRLGGGRSADVQASAATPVTASRPFAIGNAAPMQAEETKPLLYPFWGTSDPVEAKRMMREQQLSLTDKEGAGMNLSSSGPGEGISELGRRGHMGDTLAGFMLQGRSGKEGADMNSAERAMWQEQNKLLRKQAEALAKLPLLGGTLGVLNRNIQL